MTSIDVGASNRLHLAGFGVAYRQVLGACGSVHQVSASGPLGRIEVAAGTRAEAFALALAEARVLLSRID